MLGVIIRGVTVRDINYLIIYHNVSAFVLIGLFFSNLFISFCLFINLFIDFDFFHVLLFLKYFFNLFI